MTRTFRLAAILSIGSAMALTTLAHAQAPGMPPGPGAPGMRPGMPGPGGPGVGGGQGGAAGAETITNSDSFSSTTFTDPVGGSVSAGDESTSLPDTGGEPLLMALGGLALAASAFAVRRKLA